VCQHDSQQQMDPLSGKENSSNVIININQIINQFGLEASFDSKADHHTIMTRSEH